MNTLRAFGMRKEPRVDGVLEWSRSEEGQLEFEYESTKFGDWIIRHSDIEHAVLNSERLWFRPTQTLAISAGEDHYLFALAERVDRDYSFPFPVTFTNTGSFLGKLFNLIMLLLGVYLLFLLWTLLVNVFVAVK